MFGAEQADIYKLANRKQKTPKAEIPLPAAVYDYHLPQIWGAISASRSAAEYGLVLANPDYKKGGPNLGKKESKTPLGLPRIDICLLGREDLAPFMDTAPVTAPNPTGINPVIIPQLHKKGVVILAGFKQDGDQMRSSYNEHVASEIAEGNSDLWRYIEENGAWKADAVIGQGFKDELLHALPAKVGPILEESLDKWLWSNEGDRRVRKIERGIAGGLLAGAGIFAALDATQNMPISNTLEVGIVAGTTAGVAIGRFRSFFDNAHQKKHEFEWFGARMSQLAVSALHDNYCRDDHSVYRLPIAEVNAYGYS